MMDPRNVTGRRIVAFLIDTVPGFVLFWSLVTALGTEVAQLPGFHLTMRFEAVNGQFFGQLGSTVYRLDGGTAAVVIVLAMTYWIGMLVIVQGLTGRTLGKALVGICTVNAQGRPCGIGRATVRWLFLAVDAFPYFVPMLVGFIVTVASRNRQRVGDLVAKTWVVERSAVGEPIPGVEPLSRAETAPPVGASSQHGFHDPPDGASSQHGFHDPPDGASSRHGFYDPPGARY